MGPYFLMRLQFGRRVEFLNLFGEYLEKAPLENWGCISAKILFWKTIKC